MTTLEDDKEFENLAAYESDSDDNAEAPAAADANKAAVAKKAGYVFMPSLILVIYMLIVSQRRHICGHPRCRFQRVLA